MRRNASFPVLSHTTKVFFAIYTKDLTDSDLGMLQQLGVIPPMG